MSIELNAYRMIDHYLMGEMTEAERSCFETRIKSDLDLHKEFELQKDLLHLIELQEQLR